MYVKKNTYIEPILYCIGLPILFLVLGCINFNTQYVKPIETIKMS
jgi:uncharacterized membrane protein YvlD (DUF360 family)